MPRAEKIGILGGTFDPPHSGHIALARIAETEAGLDRVLFVVAKEPPHKAHHVFAKPMQRWTLVQAALQNEPNFEPCDVELQREGPSYTADTVEQLHARYPHAQLYLILGADALQDFPRWHQPERILQWAYLLAAPRAGSDTYVPPSLEGRCTVLRSVPPDISSTLIRQKIERGESIHGLVPDPVEGLIRQWRLYHAVSESAPR